MPKTPTPARSHRVLVVTDAAEPSKSLRDAIRHRAEDDDAKFRLIVLNPARAELHPMDAIEETLFAEPVDEIILDVPPHHLSSWPRQDLAHRLAHFNIPVVTIRPGHRARG